MPDTNDDTFRSFSGQAESTTPPHASPTTTRESSTHRAPLPASAADSASDRAPTAPNMQSKALNSARSLNVSGPPSNANSPQSSRDTSPARPSHRQAGSSGTLPKSGLRSRKSSTDVSPNRGPSLAGSSSTVPSAAAIQRALSSANIPQLPPAPSTQDPSRVPRPLKSNSGTNSGDNTPHWPISPRLKSPPPTDTRSRSRRNSLRAQPKKPEPPPTPAIVVQSSSPAPASRIPVKDEASNSDQEEPPMSMKASSRGASGVAPKLETVQESSLPPTPGIDRLIVESFPPSSHSLKSSDEERNDVTSSKITEDLSASSNKHNESGSETTIKDDKPGKMQEQRSASAAHRPGTLPSKSSSSTLATNKARAEASTRNNMTVETETVPSIAQTSINNQDRSVSGRTDGSLRLKPSNETIRPKKKKEAPKRKAPSIHSGTGRSPRISYQHHHHSSAVASSLGSPVSYRSYDERRSVLTMSPPSPEMASRTLSQRPPSLYYFYSSTNSSYRKASSKADVFEQKVASAVDEANSSDSDATFIYESNPPEQQPHRSRHHHSRTPSMTSIASLIDSRNTIRDQHKNPGKKSSMKFANPYNNPNAVLDSLDRGDGTSRIGSGRVSGGSHHHHIGRHGQGRGALNNLVMDSDSSMPSMPQSSRARGASSRHPSQPNSPRFHTFNVGNGSGNGNGSSHGNGNGTKKHGEYSTYDVDTENAADDERTPLISSVRSPRVRTPRRRNSVTLRQLERRHRRNGGWCRRFAGCLVLSILLLVLIFSAVGLVFATTKPLTRVRVVEIQNVIASQEEIMLDLVVEAENPNIIGVTIADMEVSIFAKSKHLGSDKWWREHGKKHSDEEDWMPIKVSADEETVIVTRGIDEGTDPIDDPGIGEPRNMLLGRIFHFDSTLNFDGSFFHRHLANSSGEIRLSKPGNKTEAGGTERWEEVLQYPFELIVKGVFKYQLPLSTRDHTVLVNAAYFYDPDAEKKKKLKVPQLVERRAEKSNLLPPSVKISTKPLGRFDLRGRSPALLGPP